MKISDLLNNVFKRSKTPKIEIAKDNSKINENSWKNNIHCETHADEVSKAQERWQKRAEQIKATENLILFQDGHLTEEEIIKNILENKEEDKVLEDVDIASLIAISDATQHEDDMGEENIRDYLEDNENNIVKLVDKMVERARKRAKENASLDVTLFVERKATTINDFISEIENEKNIRGIG